MPDATRQTPGEPRDCVCTHCGWAGTQTPGARGWYHCPDCTYILILLPKEGAS